jgi:hypothetical protein
MAVNKITAQAIDKIISQGLRSFSGNHKALPGRKGIGNFFAPAAGKEKEGRGKKKPETGDAKKVSFHSCYVRRAHH